MQATNRLALLHHAKETSKSLILNNTALEYCNGIAIQPNLDTFRYNMCRNLITLTVHELLFARLFLAPPLVAPARPRVPG